VFGVPALLCLAFGVAFAQEPDPESPHGPIPSVEAAPDYVPPPSEPVAPSVPAAEAAPVAEAAEAPVTEAEEVPTPVIDEAAQPAIAEKAAKPEKVKTEKPPKAPREPRESGSSGLRVGAKAGLGVSAFAGHKALTTSEAVPAPFAFIIEGERFALALKPLVSTSVGVSAEYGLDGYVDIGLPFSVAAEFQYTLYTAYSAARGSLTQGYDFPPMYEAGVELHALELPILARLRYDIFYCEVGPQFGANLFAKAFANSELKKPVLNYFAAGPALGAGVDFNGVLIGLRGYIDALQYAKNSNGRPWTLQAGLTVYPF
jgi:hypothetical protein